MAPDVTRATARGALTLHIDEQVVRVLREQLPQVAAHTVAAVTAEVPGYTGALSGAMGENIGAAVQMALAGFLKLAAGARDADPSTPLGPTLEGAYDLGRGEARNGRSMDALLAAYRVGARVAWRELAAVGGAGRGRGHDDGAVRRAGVRLHRRAVRRQRRGAHRRAVDERAGPRALPRAAGPAPARRRRPGRARGRGRARRAGRRRRP